MVCRFDPKLPAAFEITTFTMSRKLNGRNDTASRNPKLYQETTNNSSTWWWHTWTPILFQTEQVTAASEPCLNHCKLWVSASECYGFAPLRHCLANNFFQIRCVSCVDLCIAKNSYFNSVTRIYNVAAVVGGGTVLDKIRPALGFLRITQNYPKI